MLVEVSNKEQSVKLAALNHKNLASHGVSVAPFKALNHTKGIVRSLALAQSTEEKLLDTLAGQGVMEIHCIKINKNGGKLATNTYVLTFNRITLPRIVRITDWHHELIEEYQHKPRMGYKCQKFGHVMKFCRQEQTTCSNCSQVGHGKVSCREQTMLPL